MRVTPREHACEASHAAPRGASPGEARGLGERRHAAATPRRRHAATQPLRKAAHSRGHRGTAGRRSLTSRRDGAYFLKKVPYVAKAWRRPGSLRSERTRWRR